MRRPRAHRPAKLAAAFYLAALGLPALVPVAAGLGHAVFHFGEALEEARAFEAAFLAPGPDHLAGAATAHDRAPVIDPAGPSEAITTDGHRHDEAIRADGSSSHVNARPHSHGPDGVVHSHNALVDGAIALTIGTGDQMTSVPTVSGVDNHVPAGSPELAGPPSFETTTFVVASPTHLRSFPPAAPPPKA